MQTFAGHLQTNIMKAYRKLTLPDSSIYQPVKTEYQHLRIEKFQGMMYSIPQIAHCVHRGCCVPCYIRSSSCGSVYGVSTQTVAVVWSQFMESMANQYVPTPTGLCEFLVLLYIVMNIATG